MSKNNRRLRIQPVSTGFIATIICSVTCHCKRFNIGLAQVEHFLTVLVQNGRNQSQISGGKNDFPGNIWSFGVIQGVWC